MQSFHIPNRGAGRHLLAGIALAAVVGFAACSSGDNLEPGPNLPENPSNPALRDAAFVFDVNLKTKTVKVTAPTKAFNPADLRLAARAAGAPDASIMGPNFSLLSNDAIAISTSNFFASNPGAITPNKIRVYFDVQIQNRLTGINLATPTFPNAPAGEDGVLLFPYSTNVTTTSGGTGIEGGNNVVVELPSQGEVQPSVDWNGSGSPDTPAFPSAPGAGGDPFNFFNDASCTVALSPGSLSDCFRYETFGPIPAGGLSGSRRVGFDIDASVGEFRARLIVASDLQPSGTGSSGMVAGQVTSPERGALQGVTVTVQGVAATQNTDASGNYTFTGVGLGTRTVTLSNLPSGCTTITPLNGQAVTVVGGGTATQNYSVTCTPFTGTVSGSLTRTGTGTQSLAGITFTIDPDASGAANATGTVSGSGASANYSATVPVGLGAGAGSGVITFGNLPAGCSVSGTVTYTGLTSGGTASGSPEPVTIDCTAATVPARYVYKSAWQPVAGSTVDLSITFDPSGYNDPAVEGANPDPIDAADAIVTLTGTNVGRLTAVSAVATASFGTATLGGALPNTSFTSNTTTLGLTTVQEVARLRYTIGGSGAASIGTLTSSIHAGEAGNDYNLIFSGAGQNIDVIEAGAAGNPALVLP